MSRIQPKSIRKIIFWALDFIQDLFEFPKGSAKNFQRSGGTPGVPQNYFAVRDQKSVLILTYLALHGSYVLQSAQNSQITLRIDPLGSPNSQMGCYIKIGPFLTEKWRKDGDHK